MEIYISVEESEAVKEDLQQNSLIRSLILNRGSSRSNGPTFAGGWIRGCYRSRGRGYDEYVHALTTQESVEAKNISKVNSPIMARALMNAQKVNCGLTKPTNGVYCKYFCTMLAVSDAASWQVSALPELADFKLSRILMCGYAML